MQNYISLLEYKSSYAQQGKAGLPYVCNQHYVASSQMADSTAGNCQQNKQVEGIKSRIIGEGIIAGHEVNSPYSTPKE